MAIKRNWTVYKNGREVGETAAVSEEEAINNVRYHVDGQMASQYRNGNWEAFPIETHEIREQIEKMESDIQAIWKRIPSDQEIKITSEMWRNHPITEYEPDMIAEGEVNGRKVMVGLDEYVSGQCDVYHEFIPIYYREIEQKEQSEVDPENISIFDLLEGRIE